MHRLECVLVVCFTVLFPPIAIEAATPVIAVDESAGFLEKQNLLRPARWIAVPPQPYTGRESAGLRIGVVNKVTHVDGSIVAALRKRVGPPLDLQGPGAPHPDLPVRGYWWSATDDEGKEIGLWMVLSENGQVLQAPSIEATRSLVPHVIKMRVLAGVNLLRKTLSK